MRSIIYFVLIMTSAMIFSCANFRKNNRDYIEKRERFREIFNDYNHDLAIHVTVENRKFRSDGDSIVCQIVFTNTSSETSLFKKPIRYGDDVRRGDLRVYVKPPEGVILTRWSFEPVHSLSIPDQKQFRRLNPGDTVSISIDLSFFITEVLAVSDTSYETLLRPGTYEIYMTYENYDFIPPIRNGSSLKIWMGRVMSNKITVSVMQ